MEPVLRPLVYAEPLHLVEQHRERGDSVYIVSATLQEIVEAIADDLGFDGALGTVCEVRDGAYTGTRAARAACGEQGDVRARARGVARLRPRRVHGVLRQPHRPPVPRGGRPSRSSSTPIASSAASPRSAAGRCSSSARTRIRTRAAACRRSSGRRRRSSAPACSSPARGGVDADEALARLRARGFSEDDVQRLFAHFAEAEARGKLGHGFSRVAWLETLEIDPAAQPQTGGGGGLVRALARPRRARLPRARRGRAHAARRPARARAARRVRARRSRPGCSAAGCGGSRRAGSSRC